MWDVSKRDERLGETKKMNCGLLATIIEYRAAGDIDVKFEDGVNVYHKSYANFSMGKISKPRPDHLDESLRMKNGMIAEIIRYGSYRDIDVRFEDGEIVTNKGYGEFKKGEVANPNLGKFASVKEKNQAKIGETNTMNCGMDATIISYETYNDITVEFEDGTKEQTRYGAFKKGAVKNRNFIISGESLFEGVVLYYLSTLGFKHMTGRDMSNLGFERYEIDVLNVGTKIGIEIDGIHHTKERDIKKNKQFYSDFSTKLIRIRDNSLPKLEDSYSIDYYIDMGKGAFSKEFQNVLSKIFGELGIKSNVNLSADKDLIKKFYYKTHSSSRVNEENTMNCGMKARIVDYRRSDDIDVVFEDGTRVENKTYKSFINGEIANPNWRIGETRMMNCGMEATIIRYEDARNIDIQFKDGTIVEQREYARFKAGRIKNRNLIFIKHIGEVATMNCGMEAMVVAHRRCDDIDVEFKDGTLVENKTYKAFKKGAIDNPNIHKEAQKYLGMTRKMNCGLIAEIIAYRGSEDIDVKFEDDEVAYHKSCGNFMTGSIKHPKLGQNAAITAKQRAERLGKKLMMNCGMEAKIIEYRSAHDIDVRFTNGKVKEHRTYDQFCKGKIDNS